MYSNLAGVTLQRRVLWYCVTPFCVSAMIGVLHWCDRRNSHRPVQQYSVQNKECCLFWQILIRHFENFASSWGCGHVTAWLSSINKMESFNVTSCYVGLVY